jgi:putative mRNA 3-end processing factor
MFNRGTRDYVGMQISFHHTNPAASHDSTLLKIAPRNEDPYWYLIDAGESVSPAAFIGPDESLDGVFLTHAHSDHYASLGSVVSPDVPVYVSPPTGEILQQAYGEAARHRDLGNADEISASLTPIEAWTELTEDIDVLPIPAGHTPGAAAFLFRIDDLKDNTETVTILATGDFTLHPAAGNPGLTIPGAIDIDILIANASTTPDFPEELSRAVETILERALSGATTLAATGALTGVHLAYVLGHLTEELDRPLPIHLVGQAAKLYAALEYDVPGVTLHPEFEHTDEVLDPGTVTISGPEAPTDGSTKRLFGVINADPDAAFVQLLTSGSDRVDRGACATHHVELSNHPSEQQFHKFVRDTLPRHLILKHVGTEQARAIGSDFENLFHWENDDMDAHTLYEDGQWIAPQWLDENTAMRIQQRNYQESDVRMPIDQPITELPTISWDRGSPALEAEGLAVTDLQDAFESTVPQRPAYQDESEESKGHSVEESGSEKATSSDSASAADSTGASAVPQAELLDRLDAIESTIEDLQARSTVEETVETGVESIETRLDTLEAAIEALPEELADDEPPTVTATVLRQDDLVLFRVDADEIADLEAEVPHESDIELAVLTDAVEE